jgi:hypothetical protein
MDAGQSPQYQSESSSGAGFQRRRSLPFAGWLLAAVALCWLSWPAPAEAQPTCVHDVCEVATT